MAFDPYMATAAKPAILAQHARRHRWGWEEHVGSGLGHLPDAADRLPHDGRRAVHIDPSLRFVRRTTPRCFRPRLGQGCGMARTL